MNSNAFLEKSMDEYHISTDPSKLEVGLIHFYLSEKSYWAAGIPMNVVEKSIRHSLCFGLYHRDLQVGFARVITDFATYAYLAGVFILKEHQGKGLSKWLMETIIQHPELQGLRRWTLATADAHLLYEKYGFKLLANPGRWMEKHDPDVYKQS